MKKIAEKVYSRYMEKQHYWTHIIKDYPPKESFPSKGAKEYEFSDGSKLYLLGLGSLIPCLATEKEYRELGIKRR